MDVFGPTGTYILIVALGAFAVGVHSFSMYGQRVPTQRGGAPRDPISALALPTVAGQNAFRRGYAAYLLANEVLYTLLISSTIILELSLSALGKSDMVGALSSSEPLNPIVPILASTVVITASQLRPFAQIERAIRNVAHRIAGIPRNLNSVQEQICLTAIDEIEHSIRGDNDKDGSLTNSSTRLIDNAREQASEIYRSAVMAGLSTFDADNLRTSLIRVQCLYEWTLGYDGDQIWVGDDVKQVTTLFNSLKLEFRTFKSGITRLRGEQSTLPAEQPTSVLELWEKVVSDSLMLERRLTVVLSLLLINKPDVELQKYEALAYLRDKTVEEGNGVDRNARNALGLTVLLGSFFAFLCMIAYLSLEKTYRDWGSLQAAALLTKGPFGEQAAPKGTAYWLQYFSARMDNAFFETLDFVLIFSVSVLIALVMRDALLVQKRWAKIKPGDIAPVASYLYIGLLAYIPTVLLFLVLKFMVLNVISPLRSGAQILDPVSLKSFPSYLPEIALVPLIAFVCVWFVCNYLDQKLYTHKKIAPSSLKYACLCGGLNFLLASLRRQDMRLEDAIAAFVVPALVIYSLLVVFSRAYRRQYLRADMTESSAAKVIGALRDLLPRMSQVTRNKPTRKPHGGVSAKAATHTPSSMEKAT